MFKYEIMQLISINERGVNVQQMTATQPKWLCGWLARYSFKLAFEKIIVTETLTKLCVHTNISYSF